MTKEDKELIEPVISDNLEDAVERAIIFGKGWRYIDQSKYAEEFHMIGPVQSLASIFNKKE